MCIVWYIATKFRSKEDIQITPADSKVWQKGKRGYIASGSTTRPGELLWEESRTSVCALHPVLPDVPGLRKRSNEIGRPERLKDLPPEADGTHGRSHLHEERLGNHTETRSK